MINDVLSWDTITAEINIKTDPLPPCLAPTIIVLSLIRAALLTCIFNLSYSSSQLVPFPPVYCAARHLIGRAITEQCFFVMTAALLERELM